MSDPRILELYLDLQARRLVEGPNNSATLNSLEFYQGDTYLLRLHGLQPVLDSSLAVYTAELLLYPTMNAGLVFIDAPPKAGSWKARYGGDTTAALEWNVAAKDLESVLNALASVTANGGLDVLILAGAPVNEFVYQWRTEGATGVVSIVENKLSPLCLTEVAPVPSVPGLYFIKLFRAPLALSGNFTNPNPPAVTVQRIVTATPTRNEVQRITIPAKAMGEFALTFNGGGTPLFGVESVTAADLLSALDGIYPAPGNFAVKKQTTGVFDVTFQGTLAATAQTLLGVEMYDQEPLDAPEANLAIPDVPVDLELLGAERMAVAFEITAFDSDGRKVVLARQPITLLAAGLTASTEMALEDAGAVQYLDRTVYVNQEMGSPIVTAAAGASFVPAMAGQTLAITHGLKTWTPLVFVLLEVSSSPQEWRMLTMNAEYQALSTSVNAVSVTFPTPLSADAQGFRKARMHRAQNGVCHPC